MNNTEVIAYSDEELERATAQFLDRHLKPIARHTGRHVGEVLDELAEDLFSAGVLAYVMANRVVEQDPATDVNAEAGLLFLAMLRKMPGREALAETLVGGIYREIRAAEGVQD
ncbi:hypothetical protein OH717_33945 (plasmid) [Streptomyces albidoflavus]|uniref:hypothetical protein n=1 Tax=Streptomyces albidoflavus TaxID=1886 RepID=UPI002F917A75|nr:hypothetical protein OH717_34115 [Streptomyces albidoflavus]WTD07604.1 hypothetical protein OH717_33945 [Streptomyces albidoflavus]